MTRFQAPAGHGQSVDSVQHSAVSGSTQPVYQLPQPHPETQERKGGLFCIGACVAAVASVFLLVAFWSTFEAAELWITLTFETEGRSIMAFVLLGSMGVVALGLALAIIGLARRSKLKALAVVGLVLCSIMILPYAFSVVAMGGTPSQAEYTGRYPDLSTLARNSILGADEGWYSTIAVAEEDSYGRRLFVFRGPAATSAPGERQGSGVLYAVLIAQKTEGTMVYFYPDYNYVLFPNEDWSQDYNLPFSDNLDEFVHEPSIAQDIAWLKQQNDWEQPLDESRCAALPISRFSREIS